MFSSHQGTFQTAELIRHDIDIVHGLASNTVEMFERNVDAAIANWLDWNRSIDPEHEAIAAVRVKCSLLAEYLQEAGVLYRKPEVDELKAQAHSAVDAFEAVFRG
ncbi:hypothetical protein ASD54_24140 [Rhizobium sp. Root149]|uniref:hypothetical protein n=1 Tax=Rhizobium sp. Root149 TaxID=1736473 RepID=UPI000715B413|nr:hypothetical protein [Rhizobium sp. Root149]KQZ59857.1 hypothetical protein ASD54_24140 [Rhizobium sp. Root149]